MNSIVLEYRLYKNELSFEPLHHYTSLGLDEVLARRECEFFVKDGMTYKQRSSALEGDQYFLIYVDRYTEGPMDKHETSDIKVEIRTLDDRFDNPLLEAYYVDRHLDALASAPKSMPVCGAGSVGTSLMLVPSVSPFYCC